MFVQNILRVPHVCSKKKGLFDSQEEEDMSRYVKRGIFTPLKDRIERAQRDQGVVEDVHDEEEEEEDDDDEQEEGDKDKSLNAPKRGSSLVKSRVSTNSTSSNSPADTKIRVNKRKRQRRTAILSFSESDDDSDEFRKPSKKTLHKRQLIKKK